MGVTASGRHLQRDKPRLALLAGLVGLSCLWLAFLLPLRCSAQTTFGSITGTVTDQTGAVIPGAKVSVSNEATGFTRATSTSTAGVYAATNLDPGTYRLQVEAKGFGPWQRAGLVLYANHVINVDVQLAVGSTSTQVEVHAAPPLVNTETSTTNYTKTGTELLQLPLLVRQSNTNEGFAIYNPGVGVNDSGNFYANGARQIDNYLSNDGIVEMSDPDGIGGGPIAPDLESVAEINYVLADAPAEFKSPVNFTTVTKSGTNKFHGSFYYDYNGNALNARDFFASSVPFRVYNDYAGSVGGPIKRDRTFFFGDFENSRARSQSVLVGNTPLLPWRSGDFSGLSKTIKNPFTGQAFPNNQILQINSVSQNILNLLYPPPNFGPPGLKSGNFRRLKRGMTDFYVVDGRIDHYFSSRDTVFGRFSYRRFPIIAWENPLPPVGQRDQLRTDSTAVLSWTHTFSPTLLNEFRTGEARNRNKFHSHLLGSDILSAVGIQGVPTVGINNIPNFKITGISTISQRPWHDSIGMNYEWTDNLTWTHGKHSAKFGFDAIRDHVDSYIISSNVYGTYSFTGKFTGLGFADFLLGLPQTTSLSSPQPRPYLRGTMWTFYAQDQWKLTPRLTISTGLRYELQGPYNDKFGRIFSFKPSTGEIVIPDNGVSSINSLFPKNVPIVTASQAGYPAGALVRYPKTNFYPRIGVAYKLTADGKTALRAAYGIYGDTIYGALGRSILGGPFGGTQSFINSITKGVPLLSFPNPFVLGAGKVAPLSDVSGFNPNLGVPYTEQWNLTLERQIRTVGLSIAYVGSHGVNLIYQRNINQPFPSTIPFDPSRNLISPNLNSVIWGENGSSQNYNALQISATKTLGQSLIFSSGWTWARDLTDSADDDWIFADNIIQNQFDRRAEYGANTFTPTHRFYADVVYSLPFGSGKRFLNHLPKLANGALAGWQLSGVVTLQSGQWFTPSFDTPDTSNTNNFGGRPDVVAGVSRFPSASRNINDWFNVAAFKVPGCPDSDPICSSSNPADIGRFGNAGNFILEGPPIKNFDLGLTKNFHVTESARLQFQAIFSNALNHPSFGNPDGDISSPDTAPVITSTHGNYLKGSGTARILNFALRLEF